MNPEFNARRRPATRRTVHVAAGLGALLVGLLATWHWDDAVLWVRGWRITWMPVGVLPCEGRHVVLNSSGQVLVELSGDEKAPRAGRWSLATGEVIDLGTLPVDGDRRTLGLSISELGHIVGTVYKEGNHLARAFLWTDASGMRELPGLGGTQTATVDIDEEDRVVGWALPAPGLGPRRPFLWTRESGTKDLGTLGSNSHDDCAYALLGDGRVLGQSSDRLFLWSSTSGLRDCGLPPGSSSLYPVAANQRGEVLCSVVTGRRNNSSAWSVPLCTPFLWTEARGFAALPVPSGFEDIRAVAFADDGTVLVHARRRIEHIAVDYLLRNGKLESLPVPPGWSLARYLSLNARGWLVGIAERSLDGKEERRGFILKPAR